MNNYDKNEKYKDLMYKMKIAVNNEFYYESILLEYAILEDRTESLLRHAGLKSNNGDRSFTLNEKLNRIKFSKKFKDNYIIKHLNEEIIYEIDSWKRKRNKIIHNLVGMTYSNEEIKNIALEGYEIVKKLNNKSSLVNKYFDRKNKEFVKS